MQLTLVSLVNSFVTCRITRYAAVVVLLACAWQSCAAAGQPAAPGHQRPNILLILSDDQRPDATHALGNALLDTPHLDRLAREGTVFKRAVSPNPICSPSRAEILSGRTGFRNGVLYESRRLDAGPPTWAQTLRDAGYRTWYVGKWHLGGRPTDYGFDETNGLFTGGAAKLAVDEHDWRGRLITGYRGWVFQDDAGKIFPEKGIGLTPSISESFADAAISFLKRPRDKPFFLHVSFTAPHDPLLMPPGYATKYDPERIPLPPDFLDRHPFDHGNFSGRDERLWPFPRTPRDVRDELACYYAVVSHLDVQIGRMLQTLDEAGLADNTLVIFSSDHGLAIGSHGLRGKQNMYEHTIGVPLIVRGPGVPRGATRQAQVYLRDLYPTTCELAGVLPPSGLDGKSFAPVLKGEIDTHHAQVVGYFRDVQRMLRGDRWKLIDYPNVGRRQLFDLRADRFELKDLSADPQHADTLNQLLADLTAWQKSHGDPLAHAPR